jgi:hypothetical protein
MSERQCENNLTKRRGLQNETGHNTQNWVFRVLPTKMIEHY